MIEKKVAVVTGGNRGIGLATTKLLCEKFDGDVILCARDEQRGLDAVKILKESGHRPLCHQLDITCPKSVQKLRDHLLQNYGGLDVLVNNAGTSFELNSDKEVSYIIDNTMNTNYYGTVSLCDHLFPILRDNARVVNLSSRGAWSSWKSLTPERKQSLLSSFTSMTDWNSYVDEFVRELHQDGHEENVQVRSRAFCPAYSFSKLALIKASQIQQQEVDPDGSRGILVNACCPGFIMTEMLKRGRTNNGITLKTPEEGADVVIHLSLLPSGTTSPRGEFMGERKIIPLLKSSQ